MRVEIHQRRIACEIVVGSMNTKVRIGDGGMRHVKRVNDLLKVGRRAIRRDVISENGGKLDGKRKAKRTAYLTKGINVSHDKRSNHMIRNKTIGNLSKNNHGTKRSETDLRMIMEQTIGNRSKNDHGTSDRKPIGN